MRRREFICLASGVTAIWPFAAVAQPSATPVIGFLNGQKAAAFDHLVAAFRAGLNDEGYVDGRNAIIEYRWAESDLGRVPALVSDLVQRKVSVIVAGGVNPRPVIAATNTIPIVTTFGGDPVRLGLVDSINRPGKNVTGASIFAADLEAKRLEILRELVPDATLIGVLHDPSFSEADNQLQQVEAAARVMKKRVHVIAARNESEVAAAFASLAQMQAGALLVTGSSFFNSYRDQIVALASRFAIPTIQETRETTLAGGLISYGTSVPEVYRKLGTYAGRVLKGEKPADLPILQPARFEMVINLKTAKVLGLAVPQTLLARADELIE